jgi:hypothetical protein
MQRGSLKGIDSWQQSLCAAAVFCWAEKVVIRKRLLKKELGAQYSNSWREE